MYNHDEMLFQFDKNKKVVVPYDKTTRLKIIIDYKDATKVDEHFDAGAWTTDGQNKNLTYIYLSLTGLCVPQVYS